MQVPAEGVDGPTVVDLLQPGYRLGERILRPARVAVGEPAPAGAAETPVPDSEDVVESDPSPAAEQ